MSQGSWMCLARRSLTNPSRRTVCRRREALSHDEMRCVQISSSVDDMFALQCDMHTYTLHPFYMIQ